MKLRNKKTGEIKPAEAREDGIYLYDETTEQWYKYELDLLAKWWEYYEEPKEYWYIDPMVCGIYYTKIKKDEDLYEFNKQIGNYFETEEEAEKAVEKLKAWKRLKDKGFRLDGYDAGHNSNKELCGQAYFKAGNSWFDIKSDLHLLFGGEE